VARALHQAFVRHGVACRTRLLHADTSGAVAWEASPRQVAPPRALKASRRPRASGRRAASCHRSPPPHH
jgi:hypothetical protein